MKHFLMYSKYLAIDLFVKIWNNETNEHYVDIDTVNSLEAQGGSERT